MGTVTLKAAANLKPGDAAPDFTVKDLDGKTFSLSEYRGKYVLLDFWATWCGPCVGETPNLKAVYDAFYKDKRFTMVSLSLDKDPADPRKFAQRREIAWTQGFLGDWSNDKVTESYGVYAIPQIILIGPDGKNLKNEPPRSKNQGGCGGSPDRLIRVANRLNKELLNRLKNLAGNHGVFIERIHGAQTMVAVRNQHFAVAPHPAPAAAGIFFVPPRSFGDPC